jgi:5-carboxymethyl-2-hydroxymuconate isomerase
MPHIHLNTSGNIDGDMRAVLRGLADALASFETVSTSDIKAYHSRYEIWEMGEGAPRGFVHCTLSMLSGRPPELKGKIASEMYALLKGQYAEGVGSGEIGVTLELREMDRDTYMK